MLRDFSGSDFEALTAAEATVLGPTAVQELATAGGGGGEEFPLGRPSLLMSTRPLFCTSMRGLAICFSGYRQKENKRDLRRLLFLIHSMGGRVLPDVAVQKPKVTHLVAKDCRGEKYTYATTFDIPVMQDAWVTSAWEMRGQAGFAADSEAFRDMWRVKPFHGAHIHFLGFQEAERRHMVEELIRNGGRECADYRTDPCTHVVVDNNSVLTMPTDVNIL